MQNAIAMSSSSSFVGTSAGALLSLRRRRSPTQVAPAKSGNRLALAVAPKRTVCTAVAAAANSNNNGQVRRERRGAGRGGKQCGLSGGGDDKWLWWW